MITAKIAKNSIETIVTIFFIRLFAHFLQKFILDKGDEQNNDEQDHGCRHCNPRTSGDMEFVINIKDCRGCTAGDPWLSAKQGIYLSIDFKGTDQIDR